MRTKACNESISQELILQLAELKLFTYFHVTF